VFRRIKKVDINGVTVRRRHWQTEFTAAGTTEGKKGCGTADFEAPEHFASQHRPDNNRQYKTLYSAYDLPTEENLSAFS